MTLEQRVEALEMAIANMAAQQSNAEEISDIARKITTEVIASAQRHEGVLNAAREQAAVQLEDGGCKVNLPTGGVIVINRL